MTASLGQIAYEAYLASDPAGVSSVSGETSRPAGSAPRPLSGPKCRTACRYRLALETPTARPRTPFQAARDLLAD